MTNESLVVKLSKSIQVEGELTDTLTLVEPCVEHLMVMDSVKGETKKFITLVAKLANVPPSSLNKLSLVDMNKISEALKPFLPSSQETGEMFMDA